MELFSVLIVMTIFLTAIPSVVAVLRGVSLVTFWCFASGVVFPWLLTLIACLLLASTLPMTSKYQGWGMAPMAPLLAGGAFTFFAVIGFLFFKPAWSNIKSFAMGNAVSGLPAVSMAIMFIVIWFREKP